MGYVGRVGYVRHVGYVRYVRIVLFFIVIEGEPRNSLREPPIDPQISFTFAFVVFGQSLC